MSTTLTCLSVLFFSLCALATRLHVFTLVCLLLVASRFIYNNVLDFSIIRLAHSPPHPPDHIIAVTDRDPPVQINHRLHTSHVGFLYRQSVYKRLSTYPSCAIHRLPSPLKFFVIPLPADDACSPSASFRLRRRTSRTRSQGICL
jgi:hypothetical protein